MDSVSVLDGHDWMQQKKKKRQKDKKTNDMELKCGVEIKEQTKNK